MTYELKTYAHFDSAHFLTDYHGKCENLHGHRWNVEVVISSENLQTSGTEKDMVCDFGRFKEIVKEVVDEFDHTFLIEEGSLSEKTLRCLREEGFSLTILPYRTTAENLAKDIFDRLSKEGLCVNRVQVSETPNNMAVYTKS